MKNIARAAMLALSLAAASIAAATPVVLAELETRAAEGDVRALTELAVRYEHAEGVPRDFQRANTLYCAAAKGGHAEALFKLGWVYANGRGVPRDDGIAAALFSYAAEQGHEYAARLLQYVRPRPGAALPACLLPDPPQVARADPVPAEARIPEQPVSPDVPTRRREIEDIVHRLAPQYSIDPKLALAVISVESGFNPAAASPKNAQGLMQLIPETAERFGVRRILDPVENIRGGLAYLRWLLAFFQGDVPLALAAYNAGERAVEKYRGVPPYAETRSYVRKITSIYRQAVHPYEPHLVTPSTLMVGARRRAG